MITIKPRLFAAHAHVVEEPEGHCRVPAILADLSLVSPREDGPVCWSDLALTDGWPALLRMLDGPVSEVVELHLGDCPARFAVALPALASGEEVLGRGRLGQPTFGRGLTLLGSLAGALGEAAETLSLTFHGDERLLVARADRVGRAVILDDATAGSIACVEAREIGGNGRGLLPADRCFFGYPDRTARERNATLDSSGCAAAPTAHNACLRGLLELIERDAVTIWWYGGYRRPAVEARVIGDPRLHALANWLATRGRHLNLLDLTSDLGVPVVGAVSAALDGREVAFGFAADLDPVAAAIAASTEAVQFEISAFLGRERLRLIPHEPPSGHMAALLRWFENERLGAHDHLVPVLAAGATCEAALSIEDPLGHIVDRLRATAGVTAWAVDLTRPELGVPVVRVVAPGLCSWRRPAGVGRLRDVPDRLRWAVGRWPAGELNPVPMFL
jgi:thiazole/oxazole-forming peptide maturase SagD family component